MSSKKKIVYTMEAEEEFSDEREVALLMFKCRMPGYLFIDHINKLYDLHLIRIDDIPIDGANWAFYFHDDEIERCKIFVIEKPFSSPDSKWWGRGDKMLLFLGKMANENADMIYADFTDPLPSDENDLIEQQRNLLRNELWADFTILSQLDVPKQTEDAPQKSSKDKALFEKQYFQIMTIIEERHLDMSEHERERLEMERRKSEFSAQNSLT